MFLESAISLYFLNQLLIFLLALYLLKEAVKICFTTELLYVLLYLYIRFCCVTVYLTYCFRNKYFYLCHHLCIYALVKRLQHFIYQEYAHPVLKMGILSTGFILV